MAATGREPYGGGVSDHHVQLIHQLYQGLRDQDGEAMAACYTPDARFEDPAFGELRGSRVGDMWRMLTARGSAIDVTVSDVTADAATGSAHWVARYEFGPAGRTVVNRVAATYRFEDGLISDHLDVFSMHAWSRQALGPVGLLLGWSPFVRNRVRKQALAGLDRYTAERHS